MPIYEYEHTDSHPATCPDRFEIVHRMSETLTECPECGGPVRKVVSGFAYHRDVLAASNIKEKGFRRFRRKDKGVYEED